MRRARWGTPATAIALATALALTAVGCSKDTTTTTAPTTALEASSGTTSPTTTGPGGTSTTAKATGTTTPKRSTTTTTDAAAGGTGANPDSEFCAQITKANDAQKADGDEANGLPTKAQVETFLGYLEAARDAAPDEAKDPIDTLITAYQEFEKALDGPNPEEAAFSILATNTNLAAITALSTVVKTECGFALPGADAGTGTGTGTGTGSGSGGEDGFDCSSITGFSDEPDEPTSIAAGKRSLCATYGTEPWFKTLANRSSWSVSGSDDITWQIAVYQDEGDLEFTADNAMTVCSALATYLDSVGVASSEISIGLTSEDASVEATEVLATKAASADADGDRAGCVPG